MIGRELLLPNKPNKIICLVPSLTELLFSLGLGDRVIGITKFCIYPREWRKSKVIVGGTKNINSKIIDQIQPDLIIANKEENNLEDIDLLAQKYPVWVSEINNFDAALYAIETIGELTQREKEAKKQIYRIHKAWGAINLDNHEGINCVYLIWNQPIIGVGKRTFINDILHKLKIVNRVDSERYPELSLLQLKSLNPELILLSSEPFPFSEDHLNYFKKELPATKIVLVDGEMFSWYGSRMIHAPTYFNSFIEEIHYK
jgi:ABC-type Fe3+-hydroxamate transport system substrate-binding protein